METEDEKQENGEGLHRSKNWIEKSKQHAEELKEIRCRWQSHNTSETKEENCSVLSKYFEEDENLRITIIKYLDHGSRNKNKEVDNKNAAILSRTEVSSEKKLVIAIELARSGYTISSLDSVLQIIKDKDLSKEERVDAFIVVMEIITTTINSASKASESNLSDKEMLYRIDFTERLIKTFKTSLTARNDVLDRLSAEIIEIIEFASTKTALKQDTEETIELKVIGERKAIRQRLLESHEKPIIRTIHHLACTGGTLISKCIASMRNVALVGEINPMNETGITYEPTNPILLLQNNYRRLTEREIIKLFRIQIQNIHDICQGDDVDLVLRDHSHTDFHTGDKHSEFCPISDGLKEDFDLISIVTVRHPLDSYLSLLSNGWEKQFHPNDFSEYCKRYISFIEKYRNIDQIKYEDFCDNPKDKMKLICEILEIQYNDNFLETFGQHNLSGDSGRSGTKTIEQRPRREIPKEVEVYITNSEEYKKLLSLLKYE